MNQLVLPAAPPSVGQDLADSLVDNVESDVALAVHRRALEGARRRLSAISADFNRMVEDLATNYSPEGAELACLYIEGTRSELTKCYLAVNRELATNEEGRQRISALVDRLISRTLARIEEQKPAPLLGPPEKPAKKK